MGHAARRAEHWRAVARFRNGARMSRARRILNSAPRVGGPIRLVERVRALVAALPDTAAVTLPVGELRQWVANDVEPVAALAPVPREDGDHALTAKEVAERLNVTQRWVYEHADQLGARRLSRRCVRFSERVVERWLSHRP